MKKAHLMSDFIKKISPRLGLEPTKMRQDLRKSVSIKPECQENVLSFGCYFNEIKFKFKRDLTSGQLLTNRQ